MAIIKHIASKNANYDAAIDYLTLLHNELTGKPILDKDGNKIPREEYLLDGINCDPYSFARECEALNAHYHKNQTRNEIKSHHYILSFDPKDKVDNNLTPQKAHELGLQFAKENLPGHQALICTHPDGHGGSGNIHVHIVINSIRKFDIPMQDYMKYTCESKAGCKHQVSDTFLVHIKQKTMTLCQNESLYQVDLLNPAKIRITDQEYWAKKKGQATLDAQNASLVASAQQPVQTEFKTDKEILREQIISILNDSNSPDDFREKMFQSYGIIVHQKRDSYSYHCPDKAKPIRGRQLGTNFDQTYIEDFFKQKRSIASQRPVTKIRLVVDLENSLKAQENRFYAQKVKISNLQEMAKSVSFMKKHNVHSLEELDTLLSSTYEEYSTTQGRLKSIEDELKTTNLLIKTTGQYLSNKNTYAQYLQVKNKHLFREKHYSELALYEAARKQIKEITGSNQIPSLKNLQENKRTLIQRKNELYEDFSFVRSKYRELQTVQTNILGLLEMQKQESEPLLTPIQKQNVERN